MTFVVKNELEIDQQLARFILEEALPGTGVDPDGFFAALSAIVNDLSPRNRALLAPATNCRRSSTIGIGARRANRHGRLQGLPDGDRLPRARGARLQVTTENVDPEIAKVAGPQLVVPVMNARYALNAANARWGSLYDALYGTDAHRASRTGRRRPGLQPGARRHGHRLGAQLPRPVRAACRAKAKWRRRPRPIVDGSRA